MRGVSLCRTIVYEETGGDESCEVGRLADAEPGLVTLVHCTYECPNAVDLMILYLRPATELFKLGFMQL